MVKLNVNGVAKEFLVVHQGLPSSMYDDSCNGTWLLAKGSLANQQWHTSDINDYANSSIHSYLNSTFKALFDSDIQSRIKQVKIPYRAGSGTGKSATSGANGLSTTIFLLSGTEVGLTGTNYMPANEGVTLSYFNGTATNGADFKRQAVNSTTGAAVRWWLRSPYCSSSYGEKDAADVLTNGNLNCKPCSDYNFVRPALVLPSTLTVDNDGNVVA